MSNVILLLLLFFAEGGHRCVLNRRGLSTFWLGENKNPKISLLLLLCSVLLFLLSFWKEEIFFLQFEAPAIIWPIDFRWKVLVSISAWPLLCFLHPSYFFNTCHTTFLPQIQHSSCGKTFETFIVAPPVNCQLSSGEATIDHVMHDTVHSTQTEQSPHSQNKRKKEALSLTSLLLLASY